MAAISFSNALGVHEHALGLRLKRAEVIANNLANAETPGFKARDIDFREALQQASGKSSGETLKMQTTHRGHVGAGSGAMSNIELKYRQPLQSSWDDNTVDAQQESAAFAKNALEFSASFRFLSGKFSGLTKAIKGE